jgi:hypothetical protein
MNQSINQSINEREERKLIAFRDLIEHFIHFIYFSYQKQQKEGKDRRSSETL